MHLIETTTPDGDRVGATGGLLSPEPPPRSEIPVVLPDVDPDLVGDVPEADLRLARRAMTVAARRFEPGRLRLTVPDDAFAVLVLEGELTCDVVVRGRSLTELVLPGDVLSPWDPDPDAIDAERILRARTSGYVAVLDRRFLLACARWPSLMVTLQRRMAEQRHRLAAHGAICQLPRVDQRLLAMMWHLAARTGRVTAHGTVVPLKLTHEQLGTLVGARRSTVSLGLKDLEIANVLRRLDDGAWLLSSREPPEVPASSERPALRLVAG